MISTALKRCARLPWEKISHGLLLGFLVSAVLWRGGRTLEMTWIFVGVTWAVLTVSWARRSTEASRGLPTALWPLVMGTVLWTMLSFLGSVSQNYGFNEVLLTVCLALLFLWVARLPQESNLHRRILKAIALSALLATGIGVLVYILQPVERFVGTFFDMRRHTDYWPNSWADFVLLAWPLLLLFTRRAGERGSGGLTRLLRLFLQAGPLSLVLAALALSFSRSAGIVFLLQVVLLLLWGFRRHLAWKSALPFVAAVGCMALFFFLGLQSLRAERFPVLSPSEKITFTSQEGTSTVSERRDFWMQSFRLSLTHPVTGWGPASFRFVQPSLARGFLAVSDHPHNLFLKLAMERGWPTALFVLALLGMILLPFLRALIPWKRCPAGSVCPLSFLLRIKAAPDLSAEKFLPFVGVTGVLLHNFVDFDLQFVGIVLPFVLVLGSLVAADGATALTRRQSVRTAEWIIACIFLFFALREGLFIGTQILARRAEALHQPEQALLWYGRSHPSWYPRDLFVAEGNLLLERGLNLEAQAAAWHAVSMNAYDARAWFLLAEATRNLKNAAQAQYYAERAYRRGSMLAMGTTRLMLELLPAVHRSAVLATRRAEFDAVVNRYATAFRRNSHFVLLSGNVEEFIRLLDLLSGLFPDAEPRYQVMGAGIARLAREARAHQAGLARGLLW